MFVPDNATNADDFVFGAFADGNDPFDQRSVMALQGAASYNGAATGVYTYKSGSNTGLGYWNGELSLDVDFGGGTDLGTIGGRVTGIEVDDDDATGSLTLGPANIGGSDSGFFEGNLSGTVNGRGYTGRWGGQFFGTGEADGEPGSVGGTLGGGSEDRSGSASFVGAFAAYK